MSELSGDTIDFFSACREKTGRSMLDSGDHYGRHYEQPAITAESPDIISWEADCSAVVSTAHYLNENFTIKRDLQIAFEEFLAKDGNDLSWFEAGKAFLESRGYIQCTRGNIYNNENDLSQVFVYEVYSNLDEGAEYCYFKEGIISVFYIHTGCDVRGGYGRPLFCEARNEVTLPFSPCAEYYIDHIVGDEDNIDYAQQLCEKWSNGYSSWPYGQLRDAVETWHEDTRKNNSVNVTLKTGETVCVVATTPTL